MVLVTQWKRRLEPGFEKEEKGKEKRMVAQKGTVPCGV